MLPLDRSLFFGILSCSCTAFCLLPRDDDEVRLLQVPPRTTEQRGTNGVQRPVEDGFV